MFYLKAFTNKIINFIRNLLMPTFPDFTEIKQTIENYHDIPMMEHFISFPEVHIENINAEFIFSNEDLYANIVISKEDKNKLQNYQGKNIFVKFGQYMSANSFISSFEPYVQNDIIKYICKIFINNVYSGDEEQANVSVISRHSNMHRLDKAVAFGPMRGEFSVNKTKFHLYHINRDFIAIISKQHLPFDEFKMYAQRIKTALDFLNCQIVGGNMYIFSSNKKLNSIQTISIEQLSKAGSLQFNVFIDDIFLLKKMFAQKHYEENIRLTPQQFGKLCEFLVNDEQIFTVINYILQSAHLWEEHKLVYLSIAFEALHKSKFFNIKKGIKTTQILDSNTFLDLKSKLDKIIDSYSINDDEKDILKKKFNNALPNRDSLTLPFKILKIDVTDDEEKVIEKRNRVLHGTAPKYSNNIKKDIVTYQYDTHIMYSLLYCAILKLIKYNGYILNLQEWNNIVKYTLHCIEEQIYRDDFFISLK